jgi:5-hydroxyisourate hydrolase
MIQVNVLDLSEGRPVAGATVRLERRDPPGWVHLADGTTDRDGRVLDWPAGDLPAGVYRITFDSAGYFGSRGLSTLYAEIAVTVLLGDADRDYTIPVLVGPYAHTTYLGG